MTRILNITLIVGMLKTVSSNYTAEIIDNNYSSANIPWRLPRDYDSSKDPFMYQHMSDLKLPWNYTYDIWVMEVTGIDDIHQSASYLMYFRAEWHDPRLEINLNSTVWRDESGDTKTFLALPLTTKVWLPGFIQIVERFQRRCLGHSFWIRNR